MFSSSSSRPPNLTSNSANSNNLSLPAPSTSPSPSHSRSSSGTTTPSKMHHPRPLIPVHPFFSSSSDDANGAVREKQHLSTARFQARGGGGGSGGDWLRYVGISFIPVSIPLPFSSPSSSSNPSSSTSSTAATQSSNPTDPSSSASSSTSPPPRVRTRSGRPASRSITLPIPMPTLLLHFLASNSLTSPITGSLPFTSPWAIHSKRTLSNGKGGVPPNGRRGPVGTVRNCFWLVLGVLVCIVLVGKIRSSQRFRNINLPFQGEPSTLILSRSEIRRLWEWEIAASHYPSRRRIPTVVGLMDGSTLSNTLPSELAGGLAGVPKGVGSSGGRLEKLGIWNRLVSGGKGFVPEGKIANPGLPRKSEVGLAGVGVGGLGGVGNGLGGVPAYGIIEQGPARAPTAFSTYLDPIVPTGPTRKYLNLSLPNARAYSHGHGGGGFPYPPRPVPGSSIDLDVVMDYCDFSTAMYVRDCLEVLRLGAGMDWGMGRLRRGKMDEWRHIFVEDNGSVPRDAWDDDVDGGANPDNWEPVDIMAGLLDPPPPTAAGDAVAGAGVGGQKLKKQVDPRAKVSQGQSYPSALPPPKRKRPQQRVPPHPTHPTADPACDPDYPRIFHIFWAGPFTDKPYAALLSFLFSQNLGLHIPSGTAGAEKRQEMLEENCRPQLWVWINPGPAAAVPNPSARTDMFEQLRSNPWSSPFLHPRFKESIKFRMWNTTEQLDGVPELKDHWRDLPLFNSGGVKYGTVTEKAKSGSGQSKAKQGAKAGEDGEVDEDGVKVGPNPGEHPAEATEAFGRFGNVTAGEEAIAIDRSQANRVHTEDPDSPHKVNVEGENVVETSGTAGAGAATGAAGSEGASGSSKKAKASSSGSGNGEEELFERVGSTSSKGYDRLTVVLSDMARFVLCHRYGGIYLDADTILLRDWEELFGWRGQFAYRWSRLEKYNTAVLKLHRNTALGSFILRAGLANGLDYHPMTISRYTKDNFVEPLLLRLPDALFDPAWLNTEYYQRDRPPFPYFKRFEDFFEPPKDSNAAPLALGHDGFFRGAFSYHFHNGWWTPFDPARNFPDLGQRFIKGERQARARAHAANMAAANPITPTAHAGTGRNGPSPTGVVATAAGDVPQGLKAGPTGAEGRDARSKSTSEWAPDDDSTDPWLDGQYDNVVDDSRDIGWAAMLKRTFEAYMRGERPNMYGEWINWD